ncbi:hypothetical protein GALL_121330 [mine drainage metagenome]|uniref:Lipoprotein n=1 Tax=mine drainage metagenome TaxID=410659 RepID=A0A1J5SBU9_9ZZZZ
MMLNRILNTISFIATVAIFCSCNSVKNISTKYYDENKKELNDIEHSYKILYQQKPFSIEFTDGSFNYVSIEIITDTLKYIYEFGINETRLTDTLTKYHFNKKAVVDLITQMRSIHCTWINYLDYYVDEKKNALVFISMRPVGLSKPFTNKKYYIITYFSQPQYFNSEGKLLVKRKRQRIRKINGEIFRRINDKVCYTISGRFR